MALVDLEKAFDWVPQKVIWWTLRKFGVEEWIVRLGQGIYANGWSHVHISEGYSEEFEVKVGVHQGSVLSPLLFIIVLEALSREFCSGVPWEDYVNDLVIIAESLEECVRRLLTWKEAMEKKRLRVNAGKMKIMICGTGLDLLQSSGEFPCAVCGTGVGSNSIFCNSCKHWVHKKCSGLKRLTKDPDYRCTQCQGTACTLDGRPQREVRRTWQAGGGSFLLLPRRHALSSRWLWTFNHNTCENHLEEVQGAATSSLFTPPLFQETWPCVQLLCAERNAPCQWNYAIDKTKPPTSAVEWQGNDQTDLQCQAARHCHHQVQWTTCAAWHWGSGPYSEGSAGMDMWNAPMVQSRQPFTYRLRESMGLGGPRWHQRGIAESGSSRLSTLMIEICGDLVWDLPCVQQEASYLEGGPLMWMLPLYLHVNQKSDYDDIIYKYNTKEIF